METACSQSENFARDPRQFDSIVNAVADHPHGSKPVAENRHPLTNGWVDLRIRQEVAEFFRLVQYFGNKHFHQTRVALGC